MPAGMARSGLLIALMVGAAFMLASVIAALLPRLSPRLREMNDRGGAFTYTSITLFIGGAVMMVMGWMA